ncbi:CHMP6 [Symbiodinium sp. CCMP2592]|nr:CHMP6 [Symbiodinium sp. CCMP2592]
MKDRKRLCLERCPTEKDAKSGIAVAVPQQGSARFDRVGSSNATVAASWHLARLPVFATTPALGRLCAADNATVLRPSADAQLRQLASTLHRDAANIATATCVAGAVAGSLPFLALFLGARSAYYLLLLAALLGWPGLTLRLFWRRQLLRNDPLVLDFNSLEPWFCGVAAILSGAMAAVVMLGLIRLRKSLRLGFVCIAAATDELRALLPAFAILGGCAMVGSFFALLVGLWTLEFLASHAAVEWATYPLRNSSGHVLTEENLGSFAHDDLPEVSTFSPELRFRWPAWLSVLLGFLSLRFWEAWLSCLHQLQVAALVSRWCFPDAGHAGLRVLVSTGLQVWCAHLGSVTHAAMRSLWLASEVYRVFAFVFHGGFAEETMGAAAFVEVAQRGWDLRVSTTRARRSLEACHPFLQQFLGLGAFLEAAAALTIAPWAALAVLCKLEVQQHSDTGAYVESGTLVAAITSLTAMVLAKAGLRAISAPSEALLYCAVLRERSGSTEVPPINVDALLVGSPKDDAGSLSTIFEAVVDEPEGLHYELVGLRDSERLFDSESEG